MNQAPTTPRSVAPSPTHAEVSRASLFEVWAAVICRRYGSRAEYHVSLCGHEYGSAVYCERDRPRDR